MRTLGRFLALLFVAGMLGCGGGGNSVEVPENTEPPPSAGPTAGDGGTGTDTAPPIPAPPPP